MLKVSQLIKFIHDQNPQNTPTRLCLYNFLKGFANPEDDLSVDLIESFFWFAMDYPHWAGNRSQLGNEVRYLLDNFNSFYQQKFDISKVRFPNQIQLIELESFSDVIDTLSCYLGSLCGPDDKNRILNDQNKRAISIIMRANHSIEVSTFDRKFTVRGGMLEPLRKDITLYYTSNLNLSESHLQRVEVAPYITAQFRIRDDKVFGNILRGYVFQKLLELNGELIKDQARLLFPIKRLEQFFVDRRTDPFYQELVSQLERTRNLIQQGDMDALKWCSMVIAQTETALENVFVGDKLLTLLVRDLRYTSEINRKQVSAGKHELTSSNKVDEECLKISPLNSLDLTN